MYIVFDFETTGINIINHYREPQRAIQLAWHIFDKEYKTICTKNFYISGHEQINTDFHKDLNIEFLNTNGTHIVTVLNEFMNDLDFIKSHNGTIIAHNINFDISVLNNELNINNITSSLSTDLLNYVMNPINHYCTMKETTNLCKLPNPRFATQYKYPKLSELYYFLFSKNPSITLHNAAHDVQITTDCFIELQSQYIY